MDAAASRWEHEADADAVAAAVEVHGDDQLLEEDKFFSDDSELLEDADMHLHLEKSEHPELEDEDLEWDGRLTLRIPSSTTSIPQWAFDGFTGPPGYDARMFKNILLDAKLNQYVREV